MTKRLKPGEPAPRFKAKDWKGETIGSEDLRSGTTLLSFFRYASCPLCNLRVQELIRAHKHLSDHNIAVLAVFQSPAERIARYVGRQTPPFALIADPGLALYRLYGVETSWLGFMRAWTLGINKVFRAVISEGFLPGTIENEFNRIPADFLIGQEGRLIDCYYGKDIGDHIPLSRVFAKLGIT